MVTVDAKQALKELTNGKKVRRKLWGNWRYLYMDSFGHIRVRFNCEKVDWNDSVEELSTDWEILSDLPDHLQNA